MKVSLNTIKQYTDVDMSVDALVQKINQQLGGVEEVIDLNAKYRDAVIVKIVECEKHANADKLNVCLIDDGGAVAEVPRNENGYVQVVCGAPNARAGIFAVWLPPNSTVPSSFSDDEPFVLSARPLRGVLSQGMMAAGDELDISSDHDGIIEIDPSEWKPNSVAVEPGASFAKAYGLDDTIIDIENKMFTHRPDLFGQLGVAREIAGIQHKQFTSPRWYTDDPMFGSAEGLALEVFNDAPSNAPRFMTVAFKNIEVKPSPLWLQCELVRLGSKPINNIVDVTNYVMLLTAQPTHAYDYDKLRGNTLGVRMAKAGEKVTLLNHKAYELTEDDIVIADAEGPVGLAGIMGGGDSEVSGDTKNIVLEVATFDMYAVRKSAMRHGVFTDALTRFNKGQSPLQNPVVLGLLMKLVGDVTEGEQASVVFDRHGDLQAPPILSIDASFVNERLGLNLSGQRIAELLKNTEFDLVDEPIEIGNRLDELAVPFWRTDIELPEDIVEEVGRLYGFDKLPRELPQRSIMPTPENKQRKLAQQIRESLSKAGANEVLTYSFVHKNILEHATQDSAQAFRLGNALSPDLQYYRLSITPSLLDKVRTNSKAGYDEFALFEIGKAHSKSAISETDGLPVELARLGLTYASKTPQAGAPYYRVKALIEHLASSLGLTVVFKPLPAETTLIVAAPFEPRRSARVIDVKSGQSLGIVGEYKQSVVRSFKLPTYSAGFELLPEALELAQRHVTNSYRPLSRYPSTERDICFQVDREVTHAQVIEAAQLALRETELDVSVSTIDIYQPNDGETKNITLRIRMTAEDRTLTGDEVALVIAKLTDEVIAATLATVV
jgi:phenylalanyl-tRNA synthetase beta chain